MSDIVLAISVIVPTHGAAHLRPEALQSLQLQDFRDWEAIVAVDGARIRLLPWLAPALIRMRMWLPPLSQSASEW